MAEPTRGVLNPVEPRDFHILDVLGIPTVSPMAYAGIRTVGPLRAAVCSTVIRKPDADRPPYARPVKRLKYDCFAERRCQSAIHQGGELIVQFSRGDWLPTGTGKGELVSGLGCPVGITRVPRLMRLLHSTEAGGPPGSGDYARVASRRHRAREPLDQTTGGAYWLGQERSRRS